MPTVLSGCCGRLTGWLVDDKLLWSDCWIVKGKGLIKSFIIRVLIICITADVVSLSRVTLYDLQDLSRLII